ncbi:polysaccharide pyruvyl transferase family protein [Dyadobacter sp. 32]|uniref:polysaccharide pyruvyl transferase family protein n=1 Tax=Dyadobacter sp. 32 TaxID=538966 RepID=UPI0011EFE5B6
MKHLVAGFEYSKSQNIGDHIQSIAAERFIPNVNKRFDRDRLRFIESDSVYFIIMNGWFSHSPSKCFPISNCLTPIFWGIHVTDWNNTWEHISKNEECLNYFKANAPIGCRDTYTCRLFNSHGINSFYSKCLTLTFPHREKKVVNGWNVIVDVPFPLPTFVENRGVRLTHQLSRDVSEGIKFEQANKVLSLYSNLASLVITTRLHCALPCIAMGIPVIFFGNPSDYRLSIISDLGLTINPIPENIYLSNDRLNSNSLLDLWNAVDWKGQTIDFEKEKALIINQFTGLLEKCLG